MKENALNIVMVGHVDHGKSTVIGRLLYDTHSLPQGAVDRVKAIAKETGKPFEYAYLLDAFEEEQKQGITIDTTRLQFSSQRRDYVIIDAPGHKEFLKNMISGASNAEAAFLIIDAKHGVEDQTKRHAYILRLLGIKKLYVVVNKMDLVDYAQARYQEVCQQITAFLKTLDVQADGFIPISAYYGENLVKPSTKMPWYQGQSFIDTLDAVPEADQPLDKPLRLPIQDVFKFDDRRIIAGRIEAGSIAVGDEITIFPSGRTTKVLDLAHWRKADAKTQASAGESVGLIVQDEFFNQRGEIITKTNDLKRESPLVGSRLQVNLFWMGETPLKVGQTYKLKLATQEVQVRVIEIPKITDASDLSARATTDEVHLNDVAEVVLQASNPIVYDLFSKHQATGRFVLVDGYDVAGGGTITTIAKDVTDANGLQFQTPTQTYQLNLFDTYALQLDHIETHEFAGTFKPTDDLPLTDRGYTYPQDFNVVLPTLNRLLKVRHGHFVGDHDLTDPIDWQYPLVNRIGARLNVHSDHEFANYLAVQEGLNDKTKTDFYAQWVDFNAYHHIVIGNL
ncbi:sulfate adenylyltransferase subunit 1 [Lacticaseibacillus sp. GG6-2]